MIVNDYNTSVFVDCKNNYSITTLYHSDDLLNLQSKFPPLSPHPPMIIIYILTGPEGSKHSRNRNENNSNPPGCPAIDIFQTPSSVVFPAACPGTLTPQTLHITNIFRY